MSSEQLSLKSFVRVNFAGWLLSSLLLSSFAIAASSTAAPPSSASDPLPTNPVLTIQEFNDRHDAENQRRYRQFETEWLKFLRRETSQIPTSVDPAWARKATEDYLQSTGPLKAKFAVASRNNHYGFTFQHPDDDDSSRKASFHRTQRSIFMDIDRLSANEWLIDFVHEVTHSLDSEIIDALDIYNDRELIQQLAEYGQKHVQLTDLSSAERARLDRWLLAGLNRGFLSEYRAWLLTYFIYEEGLRDGTFKPVAWLEDLQRTCPPRTSMQVHVFRSLSRSWVDPKTDLFSYPYIQQALAELRRKLWANPDLVELGNIGALLPWDGR
jgi:hypothetical protein